MTFVAERIARMPRSQSPPEWAAMNAVYRGYFREHYPARSAFGASGLAMDARVEIECIAAFE